MFPLPLSFKHEKKHEKVSNMVCNFLAIDSKLNKMIPQFWDIWKKYVEKKTNGSVQCIDNDTDNISKLGFVYVSIECDKIEDKITYPMDESYIIYTNEQDHSKIEICSVNQYGLMHALKTLLFLLKYDESRRVWTIPIILITDKPEHPWRGLLVDPPRHFISMENMKKIIRVMCLLKYNVLHLHLSDDQGFCVESKFASEKFYTKNDLKEICLYANNLGIRVVPEIDIPGHVSQMIYRCPNLGTKTIPTEPEVRNCLLKPVLNVLSDFVIKELAILFKEMMEIFQDEYFHLGGDEVDYSDWKNDKKIMDYMKSMNYGTCFA